MDEYLTVTEVADRLKVKPKTIRNKIASGVFTEGVQYFRRKSISTRFKSGAVVPWLEGKEADVSEVDSIPMARGYRLGEPRKKKNWNLTLAPDCVGYLE